MLSGPGLIVGETEGDLRDRHWFRYLGLVEQLLQVFTLKCFSLSMILLLENGLQCNVPNALFRCL